jgi:hypothetical protein
MLPDRVTVLTCIGCGAMGRSERCEGECSEHKLVLVSAADYDAVAQLEPIVRRVAEARPADPRAALLALRERAREALREVKDLDEPNIVTGWWCAECGNVDLPQPCIGVCVWQPAEWVNVALYERARASRRFLARAAALTPRPGQWRRNWEALQEQARAVHPA